MTWLDLVEAIVVAQCIGGLLRYALSVVVSAHRRRQRNKAWPANVSALGVARGQANSNSHAAWY